MATRSAEDVLAGVLRIAVGGVEKIVPTLPIKATREWQAARAVPVPDFPDAPLAPVDISRVIDLSLDEVLDVVVSYDRTAALGGREWLADHADPAQLYAAAEQIAEVAFPFATSPTIILRGLIARSVAASGSRSSTSGPSPIGGSTPEPSKTDSTRAS